MNIRYYLDIIINFDRLKIKYFICRKCNENKKKNMYKKKDLKEFIN